MERLLKQYKSGNKITPYDLDEKLIEELYLKGAFKPNIRFGGDDRIDAETLLKIIKKKKLTAFDWRLFDKIFRNNLEPYLKAYLGESADL